MNGLEVLGWIFFFIFNPVTFLAVYYAIHEDDIERGLWGVSSRDARWMDDERTKLYNKHKNE